MKKKMFGIFIYILMITAVVLPASGTLNKRVNGNPLQFFDRTTLVNPTTVRYSPIKHGTPIPKFSEDFDPLNDHIIVTVTINEIRALKKIDEHSEPDFYLKVTINENEFISDVWENIRYLEDLNWSVSCEVPKDNEFVDVSIALWDKGIGVDLLCDISPDFESDHGSFQKCRTAELTYSIATGIWWGDDNSEKDLSGTGRLSGIDDNTIYEEDRDCELWFTISQNDFDEDGLPYWLEVNMYNTSPLINNCGEDADNDGIPIEWEYTYGLWYDPWLEEYWNGWDPFVWDDHATLDSDNDGLTNIEEYKTWQWGSDPWLKDIFIEIDKMEKGPNGQGYTIPVETFDLLRDSYARHNIVLHIDDGHLGGGEFIPFKENYTDDDMQLWYWKYFMHEDSQNWRRGVFHWCIVAYDLIDYYGLLLAGGLAFESIINNTYAYDCVIISTRHCNSLAYSFPVINGLRRSNFSREMIQASKYAGVIMHEIGHTLGLFSAPGLDVRDRWPWQINYWIYAPYKSCMNYRYNLRGLVDYSDGSRGKNDFNDWAFIDLTFFNRPYL